MAANHSIEEDMMRGAIVPPANWIQYAANDSVI
jgi:hypothetical protein